MKTLLIDIETAPTLAAVWGLWKQNVGIDMIERDWFIMSFSAKWLGEEEVFYEDQRHKKGRSIENDKQLLSKIHRLLDQADVVVAHNGRKFDIPKINTRFVKAGFGPASPYRIVDTLDIAKRRFAFTSNKLAYLCDFLGVENRKLKHNKFPGFELWDQCLAGNQEAWAEMEAYNRQDTLALEEVYLKLRAWEPTHPNAGIFAAHADHDHDDNMVCSKCGSKHLIRKGWKFTQVGKYRRYKCKDCGAYSRERKSVLNTTKLTSE